MVSPHHAWLHEITDYRVWMLAAMLSANTIYLRTYQLRRLAAALAAAHLGPWDVTPERLAAWLAGNGWSAGTVRSYRSMITGFYRWAVVTGRIPSSPAAQLPRAPLVRLRARPAPDPVIDEAMATTDRRIALMIRLGRYCGMRRGEIARASSHDLAQEQDGWWLLVHGKGSKERWVPVDPETREWITVWLAGRTGHLFPGQIDGHMAPASVGRLISRRLTGTWTAHTLRHRYATTVYSGCHDLAAVQELLGHAKVDTTKIYVEVNRAALRAAAAWAVAA